MAKRKSGNLPMPLSATYFRNYQAKKYLNLSAETIQRGAEYIDMYKGSYDSKENRGLFDVYKTADVYWEGNANVQVYDDDPASNTNIIHPFIEGQVALMVSEDTEAMPVAQTPSEIEYIPAIKTMIDYVLENNYFLDKVDVTTRRYLKYGTAVVRVQYDPHWNNDFGLPIITSCNPTYVFTDPNIVDIYSIEEGKFIIETVTKSIAWAERTFGKELSDLIIGGYDPYYESTFYDENEYSDSEIQRMHYIHMLIWEKYVDDKGKLQLRMTQMSGDGTILWDSVEEDYKFCSNKFPYFFAPCYFREGTVWGKGDVELLFDQQEQLNDFDDQMLMSARLTGNPQKWFDPALVPDGDMLTNEAGINIPATGGKNAVGYLEAPTFPAYIYQKRNRIMDVDASAITRFYAQMSGGRVKGVDTATEAMSMQESGMSGVDQKKRILGSMFSKMCEYIFEMCLYHWKEEKFFALHGQKDVLSLNPKNLTKIPVMEQASRKYLMDFKKSNPDEQLPKYQLKTDSKGKPKTKKAQINIKFEFGAGLPKNKAFQYTVLKEIFAMGLLTPPEMLAEMNKLLGFSFKVDSQATPNPEPTPAEMQAQSENIAGIPMGGSPSPKTAQGNRADLATGAPSQSPNPMTQGLNAKDIMQTMGGGNL